MQIPKSAIEKAIEGGWNKHGNYCYEVEGGVYFTNQFGLRHLVLYEQIASDRTFWQALGKALGWKLFEDSYRASDWFIIAHGFYDLILTERERGTVPIPTEIEKFWEKILK